MRSLILLLFCAAVAMAETIDDVRSFLAERTDSYPGLGDPVVRAAALPLIVAALDGPLAGRNRAWGLVGNLGPRAFPIRDEILTAFRRLAPDERRFAAASSIGNLGPLADSLLPEILAAPDRMGLAWPTVLRLSSEPSGLVPRLVEEAWSADRATVIAAAEGLETIPWCPAVIAAAPALEQALSHWPVAPPMGPAKEAFFVSWMSEEDDPDDAEIYARRVTHQTPSDPWPALLTALASIAPASVAAREAARSHLTTDANAERRQAALAALAHLDIPDRRELATAVAPWLGPGPRGRSALAVVQRLGAEGLEALDNAPVAVRDKIISRLTTYTDEGTAPLPESWATLVVAAAKRPSGSTARIIARCGSTGAEYLLTVADARDARFAIVPDLVAPIQEPAGLAAALAAAEEARREIAVTMLEAWWYAPWARALTARQRDLAPEGWTLRLTALAAADGDAAALAWLQADPGRRRKLLDEPPWQLRDRPELLPADLAVPLTAAMARRRAQDREIFAKHPPDDVLDMPEDPATRESLLLARLRHSDGEGAASWLLDRQLHVAEASAVLTHRLCRQPLNQVAWSMAQRPLRLRPADRDRYLRHPDPLVRRMAADW